MKLFILILASAAIAAAIPLPEADKDDNGYNPADHEKMMLDLEEMGLEFFPNGTVKLSSAEDLLRLYYLKLNANDFLGNWTTEHIEPDTEEEEEEEGGEGRAKRTIFDDDERLSIANSNLNSGLPFCALAEVSNGCSAIFIGPYHALTAGYCVYDRANRRFRTGLGVYRGRNCFQYGTYMPSTRLFTVNGYATSGRQEYDYGMIVTSSATPSPCWVSFGYHDPWNNRGLELLGYPSDKRTGCSYDPAYFSSCATSSTSREDLYLQHRCDAYGTTGGALMSEYIDQVGNDRGQKGVVGINVYSGSIYNYGPRINRDRFYQFIDWMRLTGYDPTVTVS